MAPDAWKDQAMMRSMGFSVPLSSPTSAKRREEVETDLITDPAYLREPHETPIVGHLGSFQLGKHAHWRVSYPKYIGTEASVLRIFSNPTLYSSSSHCSSGSLLRSFSKLVNVSVNHSSKLMKLEKGVMRIPNLNQKL